MNGVNSLLKRPRIVLDIRKLVFRKACGTYCLVDVFSNEWKGGKTLTPEFSHDETSGNVPRSKPSDGLRIVHDLKH
jgi:hypothetical protein